MDSQQKEFDPTTFGELAVQYFAKQSGLQGTWLFDESNYVLHAQDSTGRLQHSINVQGFFREMMMTPEAQSMIFQRMLSFVQNICTEIPYATAISQIFPAMFDRSYIERTDWDLKNQMPQPATAGITLRAALVGDCFALAPVLDLQNSKVLIHSGLLAKWGQSFEQVWAQACKNLTARTTQSQFHTLKEQGTGRDFIHFSTWHDGYDSSRLLIKDCLTNLRVQGETVVFMPSASNLIVTGSKDPAGLALALSKLEKALQLPNSLPPIGLIVSGGRLSRFKLSETDPLFNAFRKLEFQHTAKTYDQQQSLLYSEYEQIVDDLYVAAFVPIASNSGQITSVCTVTEGIPTLLPKTEFINFARLNKDGTAQIVACGSRERVIRILGDRCQRTNHYPERMKLDIFPPNSQLEQIGHEAIFPQ